MISDPLEPVAVEKDLQLMQTAFSRPRQYRSRRLVYTVVSSRAGGLLVGVNLNPDRACNYDCVYCEVDRSCADARAECDIDAMVEDVDRLMTELGGSTASAATGVRAGFGERPLRVAISGDGEPTLSPHFEEAVNALIHLRAKGRHPFFKIVLITNASGLDRPEALVGLERFNSQDEIWAKLDGGTQEYLDRVNRGDVDLEQTLENILALARRRPVIVQSLFPSVRGMGPSEAEVEEYATRLKELKEAHADIPLVQICSATRPSAHPENGHLPLKALSRIARSVRRESGLRAEVV